MQTIEISISEYRRMQDELSLLKDNELLTKVNRLLDYMYQDKYGLYMGDDTDDLTEFAVTTAWEDTPSEWDKI